MKEITQSAVKNESIYWLGIIATLLLLITLWVVFIAANSRPDEKIFSLIAPHISHTRTRFMKDISLLGNHAFLIPANMLFILFLVFQNNKWGAVTTGVVALSSLGLMSLLKNLVGRHRPAYPLVPDITNFSFPSGHAFMSVAFYGLLTWYIYDYVQGKWKQYAVIAFLLLLMLIIGFSRIYLRMHYLSDVVAGYCIGLLWFFLVLKVMKKIQVRYTANNNNDQGL